MYRARSRSRLEISGEHCVYVQEMKRRNGKVMLRMGITDKLKCINDLILRLIYYTKALDKIQDDQLRNASNKLNKFVLKINLFSANKLDKLKQNNRKKSVRKDEIVFLVHSELTQKALLEKKCPLIIRR